MTHPAERPSHEELQRRMETVANYFRTVVTPADAVLKQAMRQVIEANPRKEDMH